MPIINDFRMFGDILKELRIDKHLTQEQLSQELDVSRQLISKWESHQSTPAPEMLVYIADYFNVSTDYLIGRSNFRYVEVENTELENQIMEKIKMLSEVNQVNVLNIINAMTNTNVDSRLKQLENDEIANIKCDMSVPLNKENFENIKKEIDEVVDDIKNEL